MGDLKIQTGLLMMACYFIYLILGSLIFQALETDFERNMITSVYETKAAFLRKLNNLTSEDVESFVKNLTHAVRNGIYPLGNASDHHTNWDFSNSLFFVGSIVSTIGYGILSPKTAGGQLFCVIFALFGIPLNIIFLQHVGKTLSLLSAKLGKCLKRREMNELFLWMWIAFFLINSYGLSWVIALLLAEKSITFDYAVIYQSLCTMFFWFCSFHSASIPGGFSSSHGIPPVHYSFENNSIPSPTDTTICSAISQSMDTTSFSNFLPPQSVRL